MRSGKWLSCAEMIPVSIKRCFWVFLNFFFKKPSHIFYIHILTFLCNIIGSIASNYLSSSRGKKTLLGCLGCSIKWRFSPEQAKGHFWMTDNRQRTDWRHRFGHKLGGRPFQTSTNITIFTFHCPPATLPKPSSHFLSYFLWRRHLTLTLL